jgi:hypothetical protein
MDENSLKITELINKSEVTDVVHRYFRALDEKHFDAQYFASIFTAFTAEANRDSDEPGRNRCAFDDVVAIAIDNAAHGQDAGGQA